MDNSGYIESVAAGRAVLAYDHDEEGSLDSARLITAETDPDLQREWEDILESHGLPAERGDTALDRACYLGNPRTYTDEDSEYSTFIDELKAEPKAWWLEPSRPVVPIRIITPEELRALDPGGSALSYFVDQRTKYRFNAYSSELQAARFRGKRHTAEHNRKMSKALKEAWKRVTPEEKARRIAARAAEALELKSPHREGIKALNPGGAGALPPFASH